MSKKLTLAVLAGGASQFADLPDNVLYLVMVYIVTQAAVDCVLVWKGAKRG